MTWFSDYWPSLTIPYLLANMVIPAGYFFVAVALLLTRYRPQFRLTLWFGVIFFVTCGLHHLEGTLHLITEPNESYSHVEVTWHMIVIDVPQAVSIWGFAWGIFLEFRYLMMRMDERGSRL